jgi:hypothetical protein
MSHVGKSFSYWCPQVHNMEEEVMRDVVEKRVGPEKEVSLLGLKIGRAIM